MKVITVRMSEEMHEQLVQSARANQVSINVFCLSRLFGKTFDELSGQKGTRGEIDQTVLECLRNATTPLTTSDIAQICRLDTPQVSTVLSNRPHRFRRSYPTIGRNGRCGYGYSIAPEGAAQ
jgi:hypothetical protein